MWTVGKLCAPFGSAKNLAKQGCQKSYYRNQDPSAVLETPLTGLLSSLMFSLMTAVI
jgi:hypothetical protein